MNVRYIKSATVVIEHKGIKVLCDPWLTQGIYYGSWYFYPDCQFSAKDFDDVDYIFISHIHPDHCDFETLKDLRKDIPVLILDFEEKFLLRALTNLGFKDIREIPHRSEFQLGPDFKIEVIAGDYNDYKRFSLSYNTSVPEGTKTRQIDSLAVFSGGGKVVVNSNDVPWSLVQPCFPYILGKYKFVDVLLVSYAGAGPYPQAFRIPTEQMMEKACGAAYAFLGATMQYILDLKPRYYIPYAGEYLLGGRLSWMNKFKGTLELEELIVDLVPTVARMPQKSEMVLLNRGESFDVDKAQSSKSYTEMDFLARDRYIKNVLSKKEFVYDLPQNKYPLRDIIEDLKEAREVLWNKQHEYHFFKDISVLLEVAQGYYYKLNFSNKEVERIDKSTPQSPKYFVHAKVDWNLMNMILERKANWNNAEVGSHILLTEGYCGEQPKNGRSYEPMPHFLMSYFQKPFKASTKVPLKKTEGELEYAKT